MGVPPMIECPFGPLGVSPESRVWVPSVSHSHSQSQKRYARIPAALFGTKQSDSTSKWIDRRRCRADRAKGERRQSDTMALSPSVR